MRAYLEATGTLVVVAENTTEAFALRNWDFQKHALAFKSDLQTEGYLDAIPL